jgi:hypothetical protein
MERGRMSAKFNETQSLFDDEMGEVQLTIQLGSDDFEIFEPLRPLRVPRIGRSRMTARFHISPRHDGCSAVTAMILKDNNFMQQMELTFQVGEGPSVPAKVVRMKRQASAADIVKRRDLSLLISPEYRGGYVCTLTKTEDGKAARAHLSITPDELARAVDLVRNQMVELIGYKRNGAHVFQDGVMIEEQDQLLALQKMAKAGAQLFRKIFLGTTAGPDSKQLETTGRLPAKSPPQSSRKRAAPDCCGKSA